MPPILANGKLYYHKDCITLYQGDALKILSSLAAKSADAVVTDPPYGINTKSDGMGKIDPWCDLCNASLWYENWIRLCRSALTDRGSLWTCLNWRSLVTFQKASCDCAWPIESVLVWDKEWIGPGGSKGLRPSYEMVALFAKPSFTVKNRGLADVQRFQWASAKPYHPAEKPVPLMRFCIENGSPIGGTVIDPFAGSGTTGIACAESGRKFIGIEMSEKFCAVAANRFDRYFANGEVEELMPPCED